MTSKKILLIVGYFDWFSGYQETGLATWLSRYASVEVLTGDRVSTMFSDGHLDSLGLPRRYPTGTTEEHGVRVTRVPTTEIRSMVWSWAAVRHIRSGNYDLIIQVMPGQLLPLAATLAGNRTRRVALYGDNSAMWSHLPRWKRLIKGLLFAMTKGILYTVVNSRANEVRGYTPNTVARLRAFSAGRAIEVLPLAFDPGIFKFDPQVRLSKREELGYSPADIVVIAAGKTQRKKRLDLLIAATAALAPQFPSLKLLLTGIDDSEYSRDLVETVKATPGLAGRTQFTGFVDASELNRLFNASDIGVWPRMPAITIQQAMGTGLAVAVPSNDWVSHLLRPGTGVYFSAADEHPVEEIASAIRTLVCKGQSDDDRGWRATTNRWLGADRVVQSLLTPLGGAS
ncbi:glycosyltransferase [Isoptericola sp. b441]|uniref:Glycosyltransferase n=1 Tax=Actinotalea lenta TaxID=3064654 RepID=A0ABT9DF69_9CELL|nr:glycosyltransferase [Isoptericola sp. b441]MDO8108508.1 glycosyltransferase [Isoptericola sp. b441]